MQLWSQRKFGEARRESRGGRGMDEVELARLVSPRLELGLSFSLDLKVVPQRADVERIF